MFQQQTAGQSEANDSDLEETESTLQLWEGFCEV